MALMKRPNNYHKLFRTNGLSEIRGARNKKHVKFLKNQIANDAYSIVYIAKGKQGIGKTSTCYNLAQAINCTDSKEPGEPCGVCDSCKAALNKTNQDIIIINGAVDNSVADIKHIIETVKLTNPRYKKICIIIDEWHNLSKAALEALLAIFEDAQMGSSDDDCKYMFLLPTTSLDRIPPALISRAQVLDLEPLTKSELRLYLSEKCEYLDLKYDVKAFDLIYDKTNGCVRDALGILERVAFSYDFNITVEGTEDILNAGKSELAPMLFKSIMQLNVPKSLNLVRSHSSENGIRENDFNDLFDLLEDYLDSEDCIYSDRAIIKCLNTLIQGRDSFIKDSSIRSKDILSVTIRGMIATLRDEILDSLKHKVSRGNKEFSDFIFDLKPRLRVEDSELTLILEEPSSRLVYLKKGLANEFMVSIFKSLNIDGYKLA